MDHGLRCLLLILFEYQVAFASFFAKYARFKTLQTRDAGGDAVSLKEIYFYHPDQSQVDLSSASASNPGGSNNGANHVPGDAIDKDFGTKWYDVNKEDLIVTFSTWTEIGYFGFQLAGDWPGRDPIYWEVFLSQDGTNWVLVYYNSDANAVPDIRNHEAYHFTLVPQWRALLFQPTAMRTTSPSWRIQVSELEFWDDAATPAKIDIASMSGSYAQSFESAGSSPSGSEPSKAIDNDYTTQWVELQEAAGLQISLPSPVTLSSWTWVTASDLTDSDPVQWKLYGMYMEVSNNNMFILNEQLTDFAVTSTREVSAGSFSIASILPATTTTSTTSSTSSSATSTTSTSSSTTSTTATSSSTTSTTATSTSTTSTTATSTSTTSTTSTSSLTTSATFTSSSTTSTTLSFSSTSTWSGTSTASSSSTSSSTASSRTATTSKTISSTTQSDTTSRTSSTSSSMTISSSTATSSSGPETTTTTWSQTTSSSTSTTAWTTSTWSTSRTKTTMSSSTSASFTLSTSTVSTSLTHTTSTAAGLNATATPGPAPIAIVLTSLEQEQDNELESLFTRPMNESQDDGPPVYGVVGAVTSSSWGADVYSALLRAGPVQKQKGRIEVTTGTAAVEIPTTLFESDIFPEYLAISVAAVDSSVKLELMNASASQDVLATRPTSIKLHLAERELSGELSAPLEFSFVTENATDQGELECVFWDEQLSDWSTEGVATLEVVDGLVRCSTTHLSLFAAILRSIVKTLVCSNAAAIFSLEGLLSLATGRWPLEAPAIILWSTLLVGACLLGVSRVLDVRYMEKVDALEGFQQIRRLRPASARRSLMLALKEYFLGFINPGKRVANQLLKRKMGLDVLELHALRKVSGVTGWHRQARSILARFMEEKLIWKLVFLYQAHCRWFSFATPSLKASCTQRCMAILAKLHGGWAIAAIFYGSTALAPGDPDCTPPEAFLDKLVRSATIAWVSAVFGSVPIVALISLVHLGPPQLQAVRVRLFWAVLLSYELLCTMIISIFLASVSAADGEKFFLTSVTNLASSILLQPVVLTLVFGASLMCKSDVASLVDWPEEERFEVQVAKVSVPMEHLQKVMRLESQLAVTIVAEIFGDHSGAVTMVESDDNTWVSSKRLSTTNSQVVMLSVVIVGLRRRSTKTFYASVLGSDVCKGFGGPIPLVPSGKKKPCGELRVEILPVLEKEAINEQGGNEQGKAEAVTLEIIPPLRPHSPPAKDALEQAPPRREEPRLEASVRSSPRQPPQAGGHPVRSEVQMQMPVERPPPVEPSSARSTTALRDGPRSDPPRDKAPAHADSVVEVALASPRHPLSARQAAAPPPPVVPVERPSPPVQPASSPEPQTARQEVPVAASAPSPPSRQDEVALAAPTTLSYESEASLVRVESRPVATVTRHQASEDTSLRRGASSSSTLRPTKSTKSATAAFRPTETPKDKPAVYEPLGHQHTASSMGNYRT